MRRLPAVPRSIAGAIGIALLCSACAGGSSIAPDFGPLVDTPAPADDGPAELDGTGPDLPAASDAPAASDLSLATDRSSSCTMVGGNRACANPIEIAQTGGTFCGSTSSSTNFYTASTSHGDQHCGELSLEPDLVFRLSVPTRFQLDATVAAAWRPALYVRSSCQMELSQVACDEESSPGATVNVSTLLPGGTYYLFVDGAGGATGAVGPNRGEFTLVVKVTAVP